MLVNDIAAQEAIAEAVRFGYDAGTLIAACRCYEETALGNAPAKTLRTKRTGANSPSLPHA